MSSWQTSQQTFAKIGQESEPGVESALFTKTLFVLFIASGLFFQFHKICDKKQNGFHVAPFTMN